MANYELPSAYSCESKDIIYPNLESCPSWIPNLPDGKNDLTLSLPQSELLLEPGNTVSVSINVTRSQLPPVELYPTILRDLSKSTRSCIAQSGAFFDIDPSFSLSEEQISTLNHNKTVQVLGSLRNYGPVILKYLDSDKIGRLFHVNQKDQIIGKSLENLLVSEIFLGTIGKDYLPIFNNEGAYAVALKVGSKRHYLPESSKPTRVSSRPELYAQTKAVDSSTPRDITDHRFHLLETTADFAIPNEVIGVLSHVTPHKDVIHLPSRLIDPGSKWKVRLEIDGDMKITSDKGSWVLIKLYRSLLCSFNVSANSGTYDPSLTKK
jgi:hypothetical protein